jgi:Ca2+-binding RTX toxin-like protein
MIGPNLNEIDPGQPISVLFFNDVTFQFSPDFPPETLGRDYFARTNFELDPQLFTGQNPNDAGVIAVLEDRVTGDEFRVTSIGLAPKDGPPNRPGTGDEDQNDGAGVNQQSRTEFAEALRDTIHALPPVANDIFLIDFESGLRDFPQEAFFQNGNQRSSDDTDLWNESDGGFTQRDAPIGFSSSNTFTHHADAAYHINSIVASDGAPLDPLGVGAFPSDPSVLVFRQNDPVVIFEFDPGGRRLERAATPQDAVDIIENVGMPKAEIFINADGSFQVETHTPLLAFTVGNDLDFPSAVTHTQIVDLEVTLTGSDQAVLAASYDTVSVINFTVNGSENNDTIAGEEGNDVLRGFGGDDLLFTDQGSNHLDGGTGDDVIIGGDGQDTLVGGEGDDTLIGSEGDDLLTGGAGADTFLLLTDLGNDTITDFDLLEDTIDALSFSFEAFTSALQTAANGRAILTFDDGSTLTVQGDGVTPESLAGANLLLNPQANANTLLTGAPVISGLAQEDETLTVDVSAVADADGIVEGTQEIQWRRDGVDVAGATGDTYLLTQADVNAHMSVRFSYQDGAGKAESVLSAGTEAVANVNDFPVGILAIGGDPQVGNSLTALIETITDEDGIDESTITFQWNRFDSVGGPFEVIQGETGQSYVVTEEDLGKLIGVIYRYTDDFGNLGVRSSVPVRINAEPEGDIVLVGDIVEDTEITADISGVTDADGIEPGTEAFQWYVDAQPVSGATGQSFTPLQEHVSGILRVDYSFTDQNGSAELVQLNTFTAIANANDLPQGEVVLTGFESAGELLTADVSSVTDEDGIRPDAQTIEWRRADDPQGTNSQVIPGASGETYVTTEEDLGKFLTATFRYTDFFGTQEEVVSNAVSSNAPPVGDVLLLGTAEEDQILTADPSGVTDADGIEAGSEGYQWRRDGVDIEGATGETHILRQADVGFDISVLYTYVDGLGALQSVTSAALGPVGNVNDLPAGVISGFQFAEVGVPVEYDFSGISDEDGIDESTISYSWRRQDTSFTDQGAIEGATSNIYTPTEADRGFFLVPVFHYTDLFGTEESLDIRGPFLDQPASGVLAISGQVEQGATISADLTGIVEPDGIDEGTIEYQWLRDGVEIEEAEAEAYQVTAADVGSEISLRLDYKDLGRKSVSFTSEAIRALDPPLLVEGTPGPDSLPGGAGRDTILGLGADDRLIGGAADDLLDGGAGSDTGVFAGPQTSYSLTLSPTQALLTDRRAPEAGGQGTDTLLSIEFLDFDTEIDLFGGNPMNLSIFDGPTTLTAPQFSEIIELYIAYFNRAPDALGLFYWATEFANGFSIPDMAANFFGQPETQATYASVLDASGGLDITDVAKVGAFVTAVYNNVLGRGPDGPGFDYWVDQLQNVPAITPDVFILAIIGGAKFPSNPTEQTAIDQAYLATKSDLGASFAVIKGMSDIADATATMALFDGTDVGRDATLAAIEGHHADALDPITGDFLMPLVGVIDDPFA